MPGGTTPNYYIFFNVFITAIAFAIAGGVTFVYHLKIEGEVLSERIARPGILSCLAGLLFFTISFLGWYPGYANPVFEPFRVPGWFLFGSGLVILGFAILRSAITEDLHNRNNKLSGRTDKLSNTFRILLLVVATGLGYLGYLCI